MNKKFDINDYYMMSYNVKSPSPRWARESFLTENEIKERLKYFISKADGHLGIEIYPEWVLDLKIEVLTTSGEPVKVTLRNYLYDERYEGFADAVKADPSILKDRNA